MNSAGPVLIESAAHPGEKVESRSLWVSNYGGASVTLEVRAGLPGRITVEGTADHGASGFPFVLHGPVPIQPGKGNQVRFSTLPEDARASRNPYRVVFEADSFEPRVSVLHLTGNGQEYRDQPALLTVKREGWLRRGIRWATGKGRK